MRFRFPLTIFLSAFLLFQVQPLLGKYILPWFGGGPAIWTACLLFFETVLLAGYAYAHALVAWVPRRIQAFTHIGLLAVSLAFLPVGPRGDHWNAAGAGDPTGRILTLLLVSVGLPYFLLSSTAPLVQRWFNYSYPGRSVYRLYALSNAGSLIALISYPFVFEPALRLGLQVKLWSAGYGVFAALCAYTALRTVGIWPAAAAPVPPNHEEPRVAALDLEGTAQAPRRATALDVLLWLACATCGSTLLVATTNQMTQEVAVTPFLWIVPLAIYLITFMVAFGDERWYSRRFWGLATAVAVPIAAAVLAAGFGVPLWVHLATDSFTLLATCMLCHGELARAKPHPGQLTLYYLMISAGGALGGAFVAVAAPRLFHDYREFPIALSAACLLTLAAWVRVRAWTEYPAFQYMFAPFAGLLIGAAGAFMAVGSTEEPNTLATFRNFYGVLRVSEKIDRDGEKRMLTHGRITHGFQYLDHERARKATSYFGPDSGVGIALLSARTPAKGSLKVGVIGLGVGTIAAYGREGDRFRFYEINPVVEQIARRYFTYLKDSPATVDVVLGDARVQLEHQAKSGDYQQFDVLAVDAFSSDAIPAHLLTAECMDLYRRHLKPDGALIFHISNRSLNLAPVVRALAGRSGWEALRIYSLTRELEGEYSTTWVIVTGNREWLERPAIKAASSPWTSNDRGPLLWSDDFTSVWRVFKW
jgi:hypothetical protein